MTEVQYVNKDDTKKIIINENWLKENLDYPTILNNFIYIMDFVDNQCRWNCIVNKRKVGLFERIQNNPIDYYDDTLEFKSINYVYNLLITAYYDFLLNNGIRLEKVIEWFFNTYLDENFKLNDFKVKMSSDNISYCEKCRNDFAEFDGIVKKYNFYVEDGYIDHDLISLSSKPIPYDKIKSKLKNKYVYVKNKELFEKICFALFSDQCMLSYIEKQDKKYSSFYKLIKNEYLNINEISKHYKSIIDILISNNFIQCDSSNIIHVKDHYKIQIFNDMYNHEVINYATLNSKLKKKIDILVSQGFLYFDSSLFSKPESDYLNYVLFNKYSNSLFIRNMYEHGVQPISDEDNFYDYMILLRLFILLIISINSEFCRSDNDNYNQTKLI